MTNQCDSLLLLLLKQGCPFAGMDASDTGKRTLTEQPMDERHSRDCYKASVWLAVEPTFFVVLILFVCVVLILFVVVDTIEQTFQMALFHFFVFFVFFVLSVFLDDHNPWWRSSGRCSGSSGQVRSHASL